MKLASEIKVYVNLIIYVFFSLIIFHAHSTNCTAQSKYPADTLFKDKQVSLSKKVIFLPIAMWQRISYNVPFLECNYEPSCSNYTMHTIKEYGIIRGISASAARIARCHPMAHQTMYQIKIRDNQPTEIQLYDMRIVDPIISKKQLSRHKTTPLTVLPGMGLARRKRYLDAVFVAVATIGFGRLSVLSIKNKQPFDASVFGIVSLSFYSGGFFADKFNR